MHQISNVVIKSPDWKVATVGTTPSVSINRTNKKGEVFPNFDAIVDGVTIAGELWASSAGKWYLFAPKVGNLGPKPAWVKKSDPIAVQKVVAKNVGIAQDAKNDAIRVSSTMRDAVLCAIAEYNRYNDSLGGLKLEDLIIKWRQWLLSKWEIDPTDSPAF